MKIKHAKKRIMTYILFILLCFFGNNQVSAYTISNTKITKIYNKFAINVESKYTNYKKLQYFNALNDRLKRIGATKKKTTPKVATIIKDLEYLNTQKINQINNQIFQNNLNNNNQKTQIKSYNISKKFKNISYNTHNIFLENGVWYAYYFDQYKFFNNTRRIQENDLQYNNISPETSLLFRQKNGNLGFVKAGNYKKIKLISDNIIKNIANKYNFLQEIKNDKTNLSRETDQDFVALKAITQKLTTGLNRAEKIQVIYQYILDNIQYTQSVNLTNIQNEDKKIFSGIETFKNKHGVCEGYAKLFLYMLNFAGISDAEVIRGFVIDAEDFPSVGHAWVRISNRYYDPTFDDPVGSLQSQGIEQYKYFKLPYDLFYTNRFKYKETPEYLKTQSIEYRKELIQKNLSKLIQKYQNKNYLLLKPAIFKHKNNLLHNQPLNISILKKIIPLYEVKDFKFDYKGSIKTVKKFKYFAVEDSTVDKLIEQLNYNLDESFFFKWYNTSTEYEYRLGYDIEFVE